jgi:hypothetical protein
MLTYTVLLACNDRLIWISPNYLEEFPIYVSCIS